MGIVVSDGHERRAPEALIRNADAAMYRAKKRRASRYEVFDDGMRSRVRSAREHRVRPAAGGRGATSSALLYQPQVDLRSGEIVGPRGADALGPSRARACVEPAEFLWLAEETGLITRDRRVGAAAVAACRRERWGVRNGRPLRVIA